MIPASNVLTRSQNEFSGTLIKDIFQVAED
jgi:hypothetical protein